MEMYDTIQRCVLRGRRLVGGLAAAAVLFGGAVGANATCGTSNLPTGMVPQQESLVVALGALGNEALDPIGGPSFNKQYLRLLYDTIIGSDLHDDGISSDTGIVCAWTVSEDQTTVTFSIREGVQFTNGDEVTSEDVKFSLERLASDANLTPFGGTITGQIDQMSTPDQNTLVISLKRPSYSFIQLLAPIVSGTEAMIVSKKYVDDVGPETFKTSPMGTGPYKLANRSSGVEMVFEAKEGHFATGRPKFKRITIRLIPEETTRIAQLRTGQVDLADVSRENASSLEDDGFQLFMKPTGDVLMLLFQLHKPDSRFADPRVRHALSLAINREELNEFLFKGFGTLASTFASRAAVGYQALSVDPFDPDRARKLLQEAGVGAGDLTIQFQAFSFTGWPETRDTANAIASYLENIGVKSTIIFRDYATYRAQWREQELPEPAVTLQPMPGLPLPLGLFNAITKCGAPLPILCDPIVDALIDQMAAAGNEEDYVSSYRKIEETLHENRYIIPLLQAGSVLAGNEKIRSDYSVGLGFLGINLPMVYSGRQN